MASFLSERGSRRFQLSLGVPDTQACLLDGLELIFNAKIINKRRKIQERNSWVIQCPGQALAESLEGGEIWSNGKKSGEGRPEKEAQKRREQKRPKFGIRPQMCSVGNRPLDIVSLMELLRAPPIWHYRCVLKWICLEYSISLMCAQ